MADVVRIREITEGRPQPVWPTADATLKAAELAKLWGWSRVRRRLTGWRKAGRLWATVASTPATIKQPAVSADMRRSRRAACSVSANDRRLGSLAPGEATP